MPSPVFPIRRPLPVIDLRPAFLPEMDTAPAWLA